MEGRTEYVTLSRIGKLGRRIRNGFDRLVGTVIRSGEILKRADGRGKTSAGCAYALMGLGHLVQGRAGKGLGYLLYEAFYALMLALTVSGAAFGQGLLKLFFAGSMAWLGWTLITVLSLLLVYLYLKSVSEALIYIRDVYAGGEVPAESGLKRAFYSAGADFKSFFGRYAFAFKKGGENKNPALRAALIIAWAVPGLGVMLTRQILKGLMYLALQAGIILYLAARGAADLTGLGTLHTEGVRSDYSIVYGFVCLFLIAAYVAVHIAGFKNTVSNAAVIAKGKRPLSAKKDLRELLNGKLYKLFLAVPLIGIAVFTVLPLVFMISLAFTNYATSSSLGIIPSIVNDKWLSWTGFMSFSKLFSVAEYFSAFTNVLGWTLVWAVLATFTCYFGGIFLALLINKRVIKWKPFFRSIFVLTMAIPQLVTLRVMYAMFHDYGPINMLMTQWGWISEPFSFWNNTLVAKTLIIVVNMWVGIPYFMLLISGLLLNIPGELYEYAKIEGAGRFQAFAKITMPFLLFMTTPLLITNFVANINNFNVIWLLTGGGPGGQGTGGVAGGTDILITWLFKLTMQNNPDYNIGSAIGIIMFVISAGLSLIIYRNSASYKREGDFS